MITLHFKPVVTTSFDRTEAVIKQDPMPGNAPIHVLFTHYGDEWIRGSEMALLDLLRALDRRRVEPVLWCNSNALTEIARKDGFTVIQSRFQHAFDYTSPPPNWSQFRRQKAEALAICRDRGIQVVHANGAAPAQWLVPTALQLRLPILVHLHTNYLRRSRYVLLLHAATRVAGVSQPVLDALIGDGVHQSRVEVISNGIDLKRLNDSTDDLRQRCGIPADAFVVATVGSLIERKGHDLLIRAVAALVSPCNVKAHLLIGGDGPLREPLEQLARDLDIAPFVHFLGQLDDVTPLYRAASVFALASRNEAFGLVLAEAGACGLASVCTRVGGIPEVVVHDETGLLVPPDNVVELAAALVQLRDDSSLRRRLGDGAQKRVGERFTVDRMARAFEAQYVALANLSTRKLGWRSLVRHARPYVKLFAFLAKRGASQKSAPHLD